jgi:hypothetical protein
MERVGPRGRLGHTLATALFLLDPTYLDAIEENQWAVEARPSNGGGENLSPCLILLLEYLRMEHDNGLWMTCASIGSRMPGQRAREPSVVAGLPWLPGHRCSWRCRASRPRSGR